MELLVKHLSYRTPVSKNYESENSNAPIHLQAQSLNFIPSLKPGIYFSGYPEQ